MGRVGFISIVASLALAWTEPVDASAFQVMTYKLRGTDPDCGVNPPAGVENACGIHIHVGRDCTDASSIGGHFWNKSTSSSDPWQNVTYHTLGSEASVETNPVIVHTGLTSKEIEGRVVVVHDATGARVACSPLTKLLASGFVPYPGYKGSLLVTGMVDFAPETTTSGPSSNDGVMTIWGIPNAGIPETVGGGQQTCLSDGMKSPMFFQAGLATSACHVTGIPCDITASGVAYIAYDEHSEKLSAFVTFQDLNPFANGDLGKADQFPGAETPIIAMHLHKGSSDVNGPPIVFFCGAPPLPAMHGLPACSQQEDRTYKGYFLHPDGKFSTQVSKDFKDYMRESKVTQQNIQNYLYYNLHTTYSWAKTQGNGLIRAQLVATGSPPPFATEHCSKPEETVKSDRACVYATPGSTCFEDVIWAMSHGIQNHPTWYPGLSSSSDFAAFQEFLHKNKGGRGTCPAPCRQRRLRGTSTSEIVQ